MLSVAYVDFLSLVKDKKVWNCYRANDGFQCQVITLKQK